MTYVISDKHGFVGSISERYRAANNRCEPGYEVEAALQFFFPYVNSSLMQELADGWWLVAGERVHVTIVE